MFLTLAKSTAALKSEGLRERPLVAGNPSVTYYKSTLVRNPETEQVPASWPWPYKRTGEWGTWLAQWREHTALDLGVVNVSLMSGVELP